MKAKIKIRIYECFHTLLYFPVYYALQNMLGYSQDDIKEILIDCNGDKNAYSSLMSHEDRNVIPFLLGDPIQAYLAEEHKGDSKVVFNLIERIPIWGITNRNELIDKTLKRPLHLLDESDFKDLTVSVYHPDTTAFHLFDYFFRHESSLSESEKPKSVICNFGKNEFDFLFKIPGLDDKADISLTIEPWRAFYDYNKFLIKNPKYLKKNKEIVSERIRIVYKFDFIFFSFTGLVTKNRYLKKHKEEITTILKAIHEAKYEAYDHPNVVLEYIRKDPKFKRVNKNIIRDSIHEMLYSGIFPSYSLTNRRAWEKATNIITTIKEFDKEPRDFNDVIYNEIAETFD